MFFNYNSALFKCSGARQSKKQAKGVGHKEKTLYLKP